MQGQLEGHLIVNGSASGTRVELPLNQKNLKGPLMYFLIENSIPVASSCRGEGVCKKCILNSVLSCQISLEEYLVNFGNEIRIDYF